MGSLWSRHPRRGDHERGRLDVQRGRRLFDRELEHSEIDRRMTEVASSGQLEECVTVER